MSNQGRPPSSTQRPKSVESSRTVAPADCHIVYPPQLQAAMAVPIARPGVLQNLGTSGTGYRQPSKIGQRPRGTVASNSQRQYPQPTGQEGVWVEGEPCTPRFDSMQIPCISVRCKHCAHVLIEHTEVTFGRARAGTQCEC